MKIVTLYNDECGEDPSDWDGQWKLYSFGRRHRSFKDPETFFPDGEPTLAIRNKLRAGTAFVLSYYEHGNCLWSLAGTGPQCRWDTVQRAGLLVWEHKLADMGAKTYEAREKDARSFLETYTAWCNGEIYGFNVEERVLMPCGHTEIRPLDGCGGFYGNDLSYMKEQIMEALEGETDIEVKGDASFLFSARELQPKAQKDEQPSVH
jgi:hypothetical protein